MVIEKTCSKCGFTGTTFGRGLLCNACVAARRREWRKRDPEKDAVAEARRGEKRKQARKNYAQRVANANGERICGECRAVKPLAEYHKGGRDSWCKECRSVRNKAYNATNADIQNAISRMRHLELKVTALMGYGGACACCGEKRIAFLVLDHVRENGAEHRREANLHSIYRWAIKNNFPPDLRVLCANCNCGSYRNQSQCPHDDPIKDWDAWASAGSTASIRHTRRLKIKMVAAYGGRCECCGINDIRFMSIEHKNQDGATHRREVGKGKSVWTWARDNNWPDTLGVLCFNCNTASFYCGACPHEGD